MVAQCGRAQLERTDIFYIAVRERNVDNTPHWSLNITDDGHWFVNNAIANHRGYISFHHLSHTGGQNVSERDWPYDNTLTITGINIVLISIISQIIRQTAPPFTRSE